MINIPDDVAYIIHTLMENGYEAYAVGGCVRDTIMGREPMDWDMTTSARPPEIKALFRRTVDTGIEHGTVTVMLKDQGYEVTTYRVDGKYEDHRHPKQVEFTASLHEDLKRRDFTINAMAYNMDTGIIDEFGGEQDIKDQIIRCVGNPRERFEEDALRMLRGIRFAGQLSFTIDGQTRQAIAEKADTLSCVSSERIRVELVKLLVSAKPELLLDADELGLLRIFLPEWEMVEHPKEIIDDIKKINEQSKDCEYSDKERIILALSILLAPCEEISSKILRRLTFDNETVHYVSRIIRYKRTNLAEISRTELRHRMNEIGADVLRYLFEWKIATEGESIELRQTIEMYYDILDKNEPILLQDLAICGKDIIELGVKPGPYIGEILGKLLLVVLDNPQENNHENLLYLANTMIKKEG